MPFPTLCCSKPGRLLWHFRRKFPVLWLRARKAVKMDLGMLGMLLCLFLCAWLCQEQGNTELKLPALESFGKAEGQIWEQAVWM